MARTVAIGIQNFCKLREGNYFYTSNRESGFGRYDVVIEPKEPEQNDAILWNLRCMMQTMKKICRIP